MFVKKGFCVCEERVLCTTLCALKVSSTGPDEGIEVQSDDWSSVRSNTGSDRDAQVRRLPTN